MAIEQIIAAIVKGAANNMKQTSGGATAAQKFAMQNRQPGMQYGGAPQLPNNAVSPTANFTQLATGGAMTPQMQEQVPIIGEALKGEKSMLQPAQSAQGAYLQGPQNSVDGMIQRYKQIYGNIYR
jgi:hypothetical protein